MPLRARVTARAVRWDQRRRNAACQVTWLHFFVTYFCAIWAFSSSRKHLLITVLRLEFVVLGLYFSIYFYLRSLNYRLYLFVVSFLVFSCL